MANNDETDDKTIDIVITNSHSNNRGDEAAQRSMIDTLGQMLPGARFTVLTVWPAGMQLQEEAEVLRTFASMNRSFPFFHLPFITVWVILRLVGIRWSFLDRRFQLFKALKRFVEADFLISSPGGPYFGDLYRSHEIGEHLLHIFIAKLFRKPVMIYGMSIGPFRIRWRNALRRYLLNKVEVITLRDPISKEYLEDLKLTKPVVVVTADSAFQSKGGIGEARLAEVMAEQIGDRKERPMVGITPAGARWNFPGVDDVGQVMADYKRTIGAAIDHVVEKYDAVVVFFPQLYGRSSDMGLIESIIEQTHSRESIRVLSNGLDSDIQQAVISQMDLMIGNRYHSVIFALKSFVPTVCIAYEHKSAGVMKEVGMAEFLIDIKDMSCDRLIQITDDAWSHREEIRARLKPGVEKLQNLSRVNSLAAESLVKMVKAGDIRKDELARQIREAAEIAHKQSGCA